MKLVFPEGEIDFIVSPRIQICPARSKFSRAVPGNTVLIEHPVEIALKKIYHRGAEMKIRDMFDLTVVDCLWSDLLRSHLHLVASRRQPMLDRLARIDQDFFEAEIELLDIFPSWRPVALEARVRVRELIEAIPLRDAGSGRPA